MSEKLVSEKHLALSMEAIKKRYYYLEYDAVGMITWQHTLRRGCLKLNGATVTASEYPELLRFVLDNNLTITASQYATNKALYVYDETSDTLTLPDLLDATVWGVNSNPRSISAGLPNITGEIYADRLGDIHLDSLSDMSTESVGTLNWYYQGNGVLKARYINHNQLSVTSNAKYYEVNRIKIDASLASPIYGNSATVQPPATGLIPQVRYESEMLPQLLPTYRKNATAYVVGDIAYSANLPSWARLECVTAGTTAANEPSFAGAAAGGAYITDGTVTWIVEDTRDNTPVGRVVFDDVLRDGYIRANGAAIANASTEIPRILKRVQDNPSLLAADATAYAANVGLYLYDSANDTLTLPNYIGRVIQGGATVQSIAAGLPNIAGGFSPAIIDNASGSSYPALIITNLSGAFFTKQKGVRPYFNRAGYISTEMNYNAGFDASRSNAIYGASNTVQPPAISLIPQIKY